MAQCPFAWRPGDGLPGLDGQVKAMTAWDPDGDGPLPPLLIAGGQFTVAGDTVVSNIAAWDGTSWLALGSGIAGPDTLVETLAVYNGYLIAGGQFATAGGVSANGIAQWDGASWQALGSGVSVN